jgi:hypothetical protein
MSKEVAKVYCMDCKDYLDINLFTPKELKYSTFKKCRKCLRKLYQRKNNKHYKKVFEQRIRKQKEDSIFDWNGGDSIYC